MGKSLNGKELGNRISQKKDGLYQIPFTLHTLFLEMEKFEKKCKKGVKMVSAKYCYAAHESRLHQNDRCKRFALCLVLTVCFRSLAPWGKLFQLFI